MRRRPGCEPCVDDCTVLGAQRIGEREQEATKASMSHVQDWKHELVGPRPSTGPERVTMA